MSEPANHEPPPSGGPTGTLPHVHRVGIPPKQDFLTEFKSGAKETFFADDPLRQFRDQTILRKLVLVIQSFFPILDWGRHYSLQKLKGDVIAGLTIASLCIPQDIGYAKLAMLAPQYGLCKSFSLTISSRFTLSCASIPLQVFSVSLR